MTVLVIRNTKFCIQEICANIVIQHLDDECSRQSLNTLEIFQVLLVILIPLNLSRQNKY